MKKYTVIGQNVYVQYTEAGRLHNDLFCIATTQENAIEIASSLNVIESYQKK